MSEHATQVAIFQWARLAAKWKYPALRWMYAIPNGGHRHIAVAAKLKAEGVRAGVLDINLPVPIGICSGLWIEVKYGKNKLTSCQEEWAAGMAELGHGVAVCYTVDQAIAAIEGYLNQGGHIVK